MCVCVWVWVCVCVHLEPLIAPTAPLIADPNHFNGAPPPPAKKHDDSTEHDRQPPRADLVRVGMHLGSTLIEITSNRIAEYVRRTGDSLSEWYRSSSASEFIAPAILFPSHATNDMSWFLPNMHGNLHARQEWFFFSPFFVGQT